MRFISETIPVLMVVQSATSEINDSLSPNGFGLACLDLSLYDVGNFTGID